MWKFLVIAVLVFFNPLSLSAQPRIIPPVPEQSSDPQSLDAFIPIVVVEQLFSSATQLQGYRIEIFKNGYVKYQGNVNVRMLGQHELHISPSQVDRILDRYTTLRFWELPENQFQSPNGFATLDRQFTLRLGARTKTIRMTAGGLSALLLKAMENEVTSARWRCPFQDERTVSEVCAREDRLNEWAIKKLLDGEKTQAGEGK